MANRLKTKDPDAMLDFPVDWGKYWMQANDIIVASSWAIETIVGDPSPLTEESNNFDDTTTAVWLSGGTMGNTYSVTNSVTTQDGRLDDWTLFVKIRSN